MHNQHNNAEDSVISNLSKIYEGKTVVVFGLGKAGLASVEMLTQAGAIVYAYDDNEATRKNCNAKCKIELPTDEIWEKVAVVVLSPGIPLTHPKPHDIVKKAQANNCPIICDIELLYQASPESKFIGITGTNGKSTVTSLIGHLLKCYGHNVQIGGNIGVPASALPILGEDGIYVLEMSSYQLDLIQDIKFDISVLLNITPDHLDRHGSMENYVNTKKKIFTAGAHAIIAVDGDYTRLIAGDVGNTNPLTTISANGTNKLKLGKHKLLPGKHNLQNIVASCGILQAMEIDISDIAKHIESYKPLSHRLQMVAQKGKVTFVNDSKATNAVAAKQALCAYKNILWIVGGVAKEGGIESLKPHLSHISHAFLIGEASEEFAKSLKGLVPYSLCDTLDNAFSEIIKAIESDNKKDYVVLLSPACASFDQFSNFEERGEAFCKLVDSYI